MQQPCKKCGAVSPETDHFCRQCGAQLMVMENEFSSAATLNYGRMEPVVAGVGTGRLPPSVSDVTAGETARYYAAPPQYIPPPAMPAPAPVAAPPRASRFDAFARLMKGLFFFLLFAGLIGATASAVFFSQEASQERRRRYDLEQRSERRNNANGRAQEAWDQMEEAVRLIREAQEKAAGAGAAISSGAEKAADLEKYKYPGAQDEAKVGNYGGESLSQTTADNLNAVREFYERQFGKPVIQAQDDSWGRPRKKLLFQSFPVLVRVEEGERNQVKITILNSPLRFPQS
jgi:hypothetical protein